MVPMLNLSPTFQVSIKKFKTKEAMTLFFVGMILVVLILATVYFAYQNNSGMATATTTMVLVIITGFYAWNTYKQVKTMIEQEEAIRDQSFQLFTQTKTMEKQFDLMFKNIKRDRITKEMNFLILPLKTIYQEIEIRGVKGDWWTYYNLKATRTNRMRAERFRNSVDVVDQNKYLASKELYPLIDNFIQALKCIRKNSDENYKVILENATNALFVSKTKTEMFYLNGGLVEERYNDITKKMQQLDEDLLKEEKAYRESKLTDFV